MSIVSLILLAALVLFVLATFGTLSKINLTAAGLALLTLYVLIGDGIL